MAAVPGFEPLSDPVDTEDFNDFFGNEYIRRDMLHIINLVKNLDRCASLGLITPNEIALKTDNIMELLGVLGDLYDASHLPNMVELACEQENINAGNFNPLNQAFIAGNNFNLGNNNNNGPLPNSGTRFIPSGAENTIMGDEIEDGDLMVNFQDEFGHSRYYKKSTYNSLNPGGQKRNPYTQQPIVNARTYTAIVGPPVEGGRQRTKRKSREKRRRTRR
jgi:hypothetical protein